MELDARPSQSVPLAAQVTFTTDRPTTVVLEFDDGERRWAVDTGQPATTTHVVPVLGMRPDRTHGIRVIVTDQDERTATSDALEVTTDPLPVDFPPIDVRVSEPSRMEPGVTLLEPVYRAEDDSVRDTHLLVAVDAGGDIVWYYVAGQPVSDARRLPNGHLQYRTGRAGPLYEIDMLGNTVREWHTNRTPEDVVGSESIHVDTDTLHHEAFETPSGTVVAISTELRAYDNYPAGDSDPDAPRTTSEVLGDVLVEFNRQGNVVREIALLDLFDPYRIGYDSLGSGGAWRTLYPEEGSHPRRDWAHANAVVMDESERSVIVLLRQQDAVAKIDWQTGCLSSLLIRRRSRLIVHRSDRPILRNSSERPRRDDAQQWRDHADGSPNDKGAPRSQDSGLEAAEAIATQRRAIRTDGAAHRHAAARRPLPWVTVVA